MTLTPPFRLQLFGFPMLFDGAGTRVALGMRASALFAILAIEGEAVSRARLAQLLWSDRGVQQARASLRQCLVELRRAFVPHGIEEPVIADGRSVTLQQGLFDSDLGAVERAGAAGDAILLAQALQAAAPRALLDEIMVGGDFQNWAAALRTRVEADLRTHLATLLAPPTDANAARALARARLAHNSTCALALSVLHGGVVEVSAAPVQRAALPPLALPVDAPPAIIIEHFEIGEDLDASITPLALAIREEVISGLARFRNVRVVAVPADPGRSSAAALLGAGYTLGVTLRTARGGQIVTARLSPLDGSDVLWTDRFELARDDVQAAVDHIVERIVAAIAPTVETHLAGIGDDRPAGALYARYLAAKARSQRPSSFAEARALADELEAILVQAPRFAAAHMSLARLYNTDFAWTRAMSSGERERDRALELARAAMALDRSNIHCYSLLGWCHLRRHEWAAARRFFDEGARLNPYDGMRLMEIAYGLLHLGDFDAGEALLRRCLAINPVADDGFYFDLGILEMVRGDPLRACEHLAMIADPDPWGSIAIALAAVQAGKSFAQPRAAARSAVAAMWPGGRLPSFAAVRDWMVTRLPFRSADHRERLIEGLPVLFG